ncbi:hypothetical protein M407DRAFT_26426 [Tulasnella calospora MUT 4182]|uniref:Protein kinase domain-containing protein n=1 Tax=Tulasnella calospora MUT 4182 TaxID=1051891 RepID=A0A0C3QE94_9AGAM|nr:hypothetical protein M407DRAFT_26426 [Tulasnella calospora MUT 4182]
MWLIFPWEEHGNLKDFVALRDWEIPERISLIRDVARGVEYLHNRNPPICHGDLKSINILVTSECSAVITDLGSARRIPTKDSDAQITQTEKKALPALKFEATFCASTNTMTLTGNEYTLRWAAPELLMNEGPSLCSDIWALGWIFYEVMTNSVPFQHVQQDSLIVIQVMNGDLPSVTDHARMSLMTRLCSLMIGCWSVDPSERPTAEYCRKLIKWMPAIIPDPQRLSGTAVSRTRSPELLMKLGKMHKQQDDYINASKFFTEALGIYMGTGDGAGVASALCGLAATYRLQNKYSKAFKLYSQALKIRTEIGDRKGRAKALWGLAEVHRLQNKRSKAISCYSEALKIRTDLGDKEGRAEVLFGLAEVHRLQNECSQAVAFYSEALQIRRDTGNRKERAKALLGLAYVHRIQKEDSKAVTFFSEALQIFTEIGNRKGRAQALLCLADVHRDQNLHSDALCFYEQAAEIFRQIGHTSNAAAATARGAHIRRQLERVKVE